MARAYNVLDRHAEVLQLLDNVGVADDLPLDAGIRYQRAIALLGLEQAVEAQAEFRATLASNPHHTHACMRLSGLLRRSGRVAESMCPCDDLEAKGDNHAQLLLDRGRAFALGDKMDDAARLLFDRRRVKCAAFASPAEFGDSKAFDVAVACEILANPFPLSDFPPNEEVNRGSTRVHHLMSGARPELVRALLDAIQNAVSSHASALAQTADSESDP